MAIGAAWAKGKWAVGECARSGRKMLLRNMVADGYYPNLIVDPEWYEPKHPQESLPSVRDPTSLFRPAPERDQIGASILLGGAPAVDTVPGGGFGVTLGLGSGSAALPFGYSLGQVTSDFTPIPPPPAGTKASDYGSTEAELCNNAEPGGAPFRLDAFWKPDGTRCYTTMQNSVAAQNDVSPAWSCTPGWTNRVTTGAITNNRSIWWSPDGTKMSICTRVPSTAFRIIVWDQSATPWDLTVLGASTFKNFGPGGAGGPLDHIWSADGLTCWVHYTGAIPAGTSTILKYVATIPFDPVSLGSGFVASFDMFPDANNVRTIAFSTDGTVMYAMQGQNLVSWNLTVAFDITTMTNYTIGPAIAAASLSIPRGINVRPSNQDIFIEGDQNLRRMAWFRLGTP